jgi:hypothetical protein
VMLRLTHWPRLGFHSAEALFALAVLTLAP